MSISLGTVIMTHPIMPVSFCQLVLPSPLKLSPGKRAGKTSRYLPRFDSEKNACWWEWYPTVQERESDGWETPRQGSGYHRRRRERLAKKNNEETNEERIVGEELFADEPDSEYDARDDYADAESMAWEQLHDENARRAKLASAWMTKQKF